MGHNQIIGFIIATILVVALSWIISVREKRYHGITRFFSFESIALMTILNAKYWFLNPFSALQIVSWILLIVCIPVVISAFVFLFSTGKPRGLVEFEATSKLVTTGIYRYIRHPMYCALFLLGFGLFFKHIDTVTVIVIIANTIAVYLTAVIEQVEMTKRFGGEYREYMKRTKMFIPHVF